MWFVSLLAYALPSALLMYAIGALVVYKLRLTKITKIAGFFIAWPVTAITALLMANETTILSAEKEIFPAATIGAIISVCGIALAGQEWFKFKNYKKNYRYNFNQKIDEKYWELAENEFNSERKTGLWAESYSDAKGDENLAKAIYLKKRATQLAAEESSIEPQIKLPVMAVQRDEQVTGIDWLEQVTGLNWLKEVFFCVLLFVIFMGLSLLA
jgi:hypothetical protein